MVRFSTFRATNGSLKNTSAVDRESNHTCSDDLIPGGSWKTFQQKPKPHLGKRSITRVALKRTYLKTISKMVKDWSTVCTRSDAVEKSLIVNSWSRLLSSYIVNEILYSLKGTPSTKNRGNGSDTVLLTPKSSSVVTVLNESSIIVSTSSEPEVDITKLDKEVPVSRTPNETVRVWTARCVSVPRFSRASWMSQNKTCCRARTQRRTDDERVNSWKDYMKREIVIKRTIWILK